MEKKLFVLFFTLLISFLSTEAQQVVQRGAVRDNSGGALPGVNVIIKGTNIGTVTDFDGVFQIQANIGDVLVLSYIGFADIEKVVDGNAINVVLLEDAESLDEVVVTALGIRREAKALGYSLTEVQGDELAQVKTTSAVNSLQGRVAGVNVSTSSTGASGSSRVIIRGASSLTGNNQPLYVVDGIPIINSTKASVDRFDGEFGDGGDDISSISPDDIESVSVLKGSSAAALYGSQASNGVIMITTKSGTKSKGFGVEFSSSITFDKVNSDLYDFQNTYGQGRFGLKPGFDFDADGNVVPITDPEDQISSAEASALQSWGMPLDGSTIINSDGVYRPYANAGNNIDKFYDTGTTSINTVSLVKGGEDFSYRLSGSFLDNNDVFPNSTLDRQSYSFNSSAKINPKLTSTVSARYIIEKVHNRVGIGDGPGNANFSVLMLPVNADITAMKPGYNTDGTENNFLGSVWYTNPYWVTDKFNNDDKKNRIIASTTLRYDINDWLYLSGRAGIDSYDFAVKRVTPWGTAYREGGRLYQAKSTYSLFDADVMLGVDKKITEKFSTVSIFGANTRKSTFEQLSAQGDNFVIIGLEDLNNTTNPIPVNGFNEKQINSVYGSVEFDYDSALFLTFTGRNEWFSSLSFPGKTTPNNDFYWSLSGSVLLNELLNFEDTFINYAKLRASYAQVAGDTSPYGLNLDYTILGTFLGQPFGQINGSRIPNPNLVPLQKDEFEVGFDGRFFKNRLHLDLAYYDNTTTNDIVSASATSTSGFTSALLNVGELNNKGVELLLEGYPIRNDNFYWSTGFNMAYNDSEIVSTNDEGNPITMSLSRSGTANISHEVGENYGTISGESYKRDENGTIIYRIDGNGIPRPVRGDRKILGVGVAPLTLGFSNTLAYKNISLSFLIDGKFGGQVFSGTNEQAYISGKHKETLNGRENGLEVSGIDEATGQPFTTVVPTRSLSSYYGYIASENTGIAEEFVYDTDFIKFRELSLSYNLPAEILKQGFVKDMRFSLIGRNLFFLMKEVDNIDPEASLNNTNAQGMERFGVPSTRSLGFSVNVKF